MTPLLVFAVQMFYVAMLGLQSRHVRDGQFIPAAITSTILGSCGLFLTGTIARLAVQQCDPWTVAAYILAGPCGIVVAMMGHDRYGKTTPGQWKPNGLRDGGGSGRLDGEGNSQRDSAMPDSPGRSPA